MRKIIESYFKCKYKSYLYSVGEEGIISDYDKQSLESSLTFKEKAVLRICESHCKTDIISKISLTNKLLKHGPLYILGGTGQYCNLSILFDGLKKVEGPSKIANFHYVPILIKESENIHSDDKCLLALFGLIVAAIQGRQPQEGIFIHGHQFKTTHIKLNSTDRKSHHAIKEIKAIYQGVSTPPLILNSHCHICEFQQRCHHQATTEDNLSLLHGMTEKQIVKYNRRGILTVAQLSHIYRARRKPSRDITPQHDFALQALAIRDNRIFVAELPTLVREPVRIYLDIEGVPERNFDYLVGALICTQDSESYYSFWADDQSKETTSFDCFLDIVNTLDKFHVFHYGAYEVNFIKRIRARIDRDVIIDKILVNSTNVIALIYGRIYFPVYSNSLKHIARLLGYSWADDQASGINSIVWRHDWEKTLNPITKQRIITYNSDDCAALKLVTDFIFSVGTEDKAKVVGSSSTTDLNISNLGDIKPSFSRPDWRTPKFVTADLDYVNRCSYFDYQRDKIHVRTNKNIAKLCIKKDRHPKWLKATKRTELDCYNCPYCGSTKIIKCREGIRRRKCLDLKITENGVKRVVSEFSSYKYRCGECNKEFFAEQYMKMFKYGHSLKSWAMYEYVAHRISFQNLEGTFRDLFNLPIYYTHLSVIKRIMANYYRETIEGIRRRLVAGSILHADETQVHLQKGKGYVWAFTNLDAVLYVYTKSRDGSFLNDLFAGFSGVLISDFYAVYEWPHCAQQKCLIHLIRDLNSDLLQNPFDEEFKTLVADFGFLLRRIIATVDRYGLKQRHLAKHRQEVDAFMTNLEKQCYSSVTTQSVQTRIIRNKGSLFTFLDYDGVPWNNNNAEHAIKRFAHYREVTDGHTTENGLSDYLVLLSIRQTCEYRGINFFKFLLSGEIDIGVYVERSTRRAQPVTGEVTLLEQAFFDKTLRTHRD